MLSCYTSPLRYALVVTMVIPLESASRCRRDLLSGMTIAAILPVTALLRGARRVCSATIHQHRPARRARQLLLKPLVQFRPPLPLAAIADLLPRPCCPSREHSRCNAPAGVACFRFAAQQALQPVLSPDSEVRAPGHLLGHGGTRLTASSASAIGHTAQLLVLGIVIPAPANSARGTPPVRHILCLSFPYQRWLLRRMRRGRVC